MFEPCRRAILLGIFLLVASFISATSKVPDVLTLSDGQGEVLDCNEFLYFFSDPTSAITIENILSGKHPKFEEFKENQKLTETRGAYWGRIQIKNSSKSNLMWMMYVGKNDFIDTYILYSDSTIKSSKSGYLYTASQKEIRQGSYYSSIPINYEEVVTIFIRIQESIHMDPEFKLRVESRERWLQLINDNITIDNIFLGVLLIMILYSLLVFMGSHQIDNLYYSLYLITVGAIFLFFSGSLRENILLENPQFVPYFMSLIPVAAGLYYLFLLKFLDIHVRLPKWEKLIVTVFRINLILFFVIFFHLIFFDNILLSSKIAQMIAIANGLLAFIIVIKILKGKDKIAWYYVLGTLCFLISVLIDAFFWIPDTSEGAIVRFGLIGEILFYSAGLGQKLHITQTELINQLQINDQLSTIKKEELEQLVKERTKNLAELNNELKAYDQMISHDLKGPLGNIQMLTDIMMNEKDESPEQKLSMLTMVKSSSTKALKLVGDILAFATADKLKTENDPINLEELINDVLSELSLTIETTKAQITIGGLPTLQSGVRVKLYQLFYNLITNALKFQKPDNQPVISIYERTDSGNREIVVEDNGIGFSSVLAQNLFEPLVRLHNRELYEGSGIGLATCQRIVNFHKWTIRAESKKGKGSKFIITLSSDS